MLTIHSRALSLVASAMAAGHSHRQMSRMDECGLTERGSGMGTRGETEGGIEVGTRVGME